MRKLFKFIGYFIAFILVSFVLFVAITNCLSILRESQPFTRGESYGEKFVTVSGKKLAYWESGNPAGKPVIMVHGFGAWSQTWTDQVDTLSGSYHVFALDMAPFGYSESIGVSEFSRAKQGARILEFMEALQIEKPVIIAHSYGGRAVAEATLSHPERFSGIVFVDAALSVFPDGKTDDFTAPTGMAKYIAEHPSVRDIILRSTMNNPLFARALFGTFIRDKTTLSDERLAIYTRPFEVAGKTRDVGNWLSYALLYPDTGISRDAKAYEKLNVPTLIIWGREDTVTPIAQGLALQSHIPNSELVILEGVNHIPQVEDPAGMKKALEEFFAKHF